MSVYIALSVIVLLSAEVVRQGVPDHGAVHSNLVDVWNGRK